MELYEAGYSINKIAKTLKHSRNTVSRYVHSNKESLETNAYSEYEDFIIKSLVSGKNRKAVYEELLEKGFSRGITVFYEYCRKIAEANEIEISRAGNTNISKEQQEKQKQLLEKIYISRKSILKFICDDEELKVSDDIKDELLKRFPLIAELKKCVKEFDKIFSSHYHSFLYSFINKYKDSKHKFLMTFAKGLERDLDAVENAVSFSFSNGFVEGTNNKLKTIKRTMYGRCNSKLLSAKLILEF